MKNKPTPLRDKLILVGIVFGILSTIWLVFSYVGNLAKCEDVKQSEQRTEKIFQKMDEKIDRSISIMEQKSKEIDQKYKENERLFDYKLLGLEKKQIDEEISQIERNYGSPPKDPIKKADLERLKRRREEILIEQGMLKEKK
jgi:hypothetical protein